MSDFSREQRLKEWQLIRAKEPSHVIAAFKGITGIHPDGPLPVGVTFDTMIAAILDHEECEERAR